MRLMSEVEGEIRRRCDRGDIDGAVTIALEGYGPELFGFLCGLARDRTRAEDAFSTTCELIWLHLARFRWESTFRVWAYRIARNAFLRSTHATQIERNTIAIEDLSTVRGILVAVRSTTPFMDRSEVQDRYAAIRAQLDAEDLMLLGLRIENGLAWEDVAKVLSDGDSPPSSQDVAALRKRFERLKARLRELARE